MSDERKPPLSKDEARRAADAVARERFGAPSPSRISARVLTGSTGSADARRLTSIARYAKK